MRNAHCIGCMTEITEYPCPHCGYNPNTAEHPTNALPPQTILNGRYLIGRVLGQGGFGITYMGFDLMLNTKIAVKEFFPSGQVMRDPMTRTTLYWDGSAQAQKMRRDGTETFLKEARKMARVSGIPNVVSVREVFVENETAYIAMEYIEGETLSAYLQKNGPLTWEQAKKIFLPAISAMEQVHEAGLIHRDLSPDNLMLQPDGTVKILDLGAAKDLNVNSGASSMVVAKSGFSPVEQYNQRGNSGPWTDVYAMGATLYYTLTGCLPPNSIDRIDDDPISWSKPGLETLPQEVLTALQSSMEVSAKKRMQSMTPLKEAMEGTHTSASKPKGNARKKGSPALFIGIAAAILAVVVGVVTLGGGKKEAAETVPAAQLQPETAAGEPAETEPAEEFSATAISEGSHALGSLRELPLKEARAIRFAGDLDTPPENAIEVSQERDGTVWAWMEGSALTISTNGTILAPEDLSGMLEDCTSLESADFSALDTAGTTSMARMFAGCTNLTAVTGLNTAAVRDMRGMFADCTRIGDASLLSLDYSAPTRFSGFLPGDRQVSGSSWEQTLFRVHTMKYIDNSPLEQNPEYPYFWDQKTYTRQDVSSVRFLSSIPEHTPVSLDLSEKQDGSILAWVEDGCLNLAAEGRIEPSPRQDSLFSQFSGMKEIDFGSCFYTGNLKTLSKMFNGCSSLTGLDLTGWDTAQTTNMGFLFTECSSLTELDLSGLDTSQVTSMANLFSGCSSLTELDLTGWDTSQVTSTGNMFCECSSLTRLDLSGWNTSQVRDMGNMFYNCSGLTRLDLTGWDTSKVTSLGGMFCECSSLTRLDLAGWDTSQVIAMGYLFSECSSLTQLDLAGWDTSNVTNMHSMFYNCAGLTELDLSGFRVSQVVDMRRQFAGCTNLTSLDLAGWNPILLKYSDEIFDHTPKLEQPNTMVERFLNAWKRRA